MPNLFDYFLTYTKRKEPPANFVAWSTVAVISAALGKKCYVPQGSYVIYPNLNIVLVGAPGDRKTTAMKIGRQFVEHLGTVPLSPDSVTRESLIDDMARNQVEAYDGNRDVSYWQSTAFVSELEQFLGGRHINQQMVGFLTAIWDANQFKERTRKGGEVLIPNPYFTLLGCCTLTWMNEKLRSDIISDGYTRRTIFCNEDEMNCLNDWPTLSAEEMEAAARINLEVKRIHSISGKFNFTIPARIYYKKRYLSLRDEAKQHSEKVQYYFSSKHDLILKVAMCLSAVYRNDRVVDLAIIKAAYDFLDESEQNMDKIFSGVGLNPQKALADKILDKIIRAGEKGITNADLLTYAYSDLKSQDYEEVIKVLETTGKIVLESLVASESPRYRVVTLKKRRVAVNLLELGSRITPGIELLASDLLDVSEYRLPDQVPQSVEDPPLSSQAEKETPPATLGKLLLSTRNPLGSLVKALGLEENGTGQLVQ